MRRLLVVVVAVLAWTMSAPPERRAPETPTTALPPRLLPANGRALEALAASGPRTLGVEHLEADSEGHDTWGPVPEAPLVAEDAERLVGEWSAAVEAARGLSTPAAAVRAGHQRAGGEVPGVGAHYVNWRLVDEPFDPARPSMLLFDESDRRRDRLLGFSYWVRSGTAPAGFAGEGDSWHMHHGLCFGDGFLREEGVPRATDCAGTWLAGMDLWMMHAWVVADLPNPWGRFAPRNPLACAGPAEPVADLAQCPSPIPEPSAADRVVQGSLECSVLAVAADVPSGRSGPITVG